MGIWYRADARYGNSITPVEVSKSNDLSVWVNKVRHHRHSTYDMFFPTFQEAKDFMIRRYTREISRLEEKLRDAKEELQVVIEMEVEQ